MKQSLVVASIILTIFGLGLSSGSSFCEGSQCGSADNSIEDDTTMLQVSMQHQSKKITARSSENKTLVQEKMPQQSTKLEANHTEHMRVNKSLALRLGDKGDEYTLVGKGQCTDEDGKLVPGNAKESIGWSPCSGGGTGFGKGGCADVDECGAECTANANCAAFGYYNGYCWLYAAMSKPYTATNAIVPWYECYASTRSKSTTTTTTTARSCAAYWGGSIIYCFSGYWINNAGKTFTVTCDGYVNKMGGTDGCGKGGVFKTQTGAVIHWDYEYPFKMEFDCNLFGYYCSYGTLQPGGDVIKFDDGYTWTRIPGTGYYT